VSQQTQDTVVLDLPQAAPGPERGGASRGLVALGLAAALALGLAIGAAWSPRASDTDAANVRLAAALQEADVSTQLQAASAAQQEGDAAEAAKLLADVADRLEGAATAGPQDEVSQALNDAASMLRGLSRAAEQLDTQDGGSWTDLLGPLVEGLIGGDGGSGLQIPEGLDSLLSGQA
jgi:hypothetical protein